jgi:hypothetical protein
MGVLELTADGATAIYGDKRIPLPASNSGREDYLRAVIDADPNNAEMKQRLARMLAPQAGQSETVSDAEDTEDSEAGQSVAEAANSVPGTCQ